MVGPGCLAMIHDTTAESSLPLWLGYLHVQVITQAATRYESGPMVCYV